MRLIPETAQIHPNCYPRHDDRASEGSGERRTIEGQVKPRNGLLTVGGPGNLACALRMECISLCTGRSACATRRDFKIVWSDAPIADRQDSL